MMVLCLFLCALVHASDPSAAPAPVTLSGNFPIKALLEGEIKKLSDDVSIVIVIPPTFYTAIPRTTGEWAAEGHS